jgi:Zn-dependent M32 family carboxypeptidase
MADNSEQKQSLLKNPIYQIVALLVSMGLLGGGGYVGFGDLSEKMTKLETQFEQTIKDFDDFEDKLDNITVLSQNLITLQQKQETLQKQVDILAADFKTQTQSQAINQLRLDLLEKIAQLSDRITRIEAKLNGRVKTGGK